MKYNTSKLAHAICDYFGRKFPISLVWDALDDLGYKPQSLTEKQVYHWACKVERVIKIS